MDISLIKFIPLFAGLTEPELDTLSNHSEPGSLSEGEQLFRTGEKSDSLYILHKGFVRLATQNGQSLATLGPGSVLGEASLFGNIPLDVDASAISDIEFWRLSDQKLRALILEQLSIGLQLGGNFGQMIAQMQDYLVAQLNKTQELGNVPRHTLEAFASQLQPVEINAGEKLYRSGEGALGLSLLESGSVRLEPEVDSEEGPKIVQAGAILGTSALLTDKPYGHDAVAQEDSVVWQISAQSFHMLNSQHPGLRRSLSRSVRTPLTKADQKVALLNQYPSLTINTSRMLSQQLADTSTYPDPIQEPTLPQQALRRSVPSLEPEPIDGSMGLTSRRRQAVTAEAAAGIKRERVDLFQWFNGLSTFAKLRLAIIILLLIWLLGIAAPVALLRLVQDSRVASHASLPISASSSIAAVYKMDSYEVASRDEGTALAIAMADRAVAATATYTPPPTNTPIPTNTPLPTNTPRPTVRSFIQAVVNLAPQLESEPEEDLIQAAALPVRIWDQRLSQLGVRVEEALVASGQQYWRLIEANWWDEKEAAGKHHIYVEVLNENGSRIVGHPVKVSWRDGEHIGNTQDKPFPEYAFNYQMYAAGNAYNIEIPGLPSDRLIGAGMGDLERRAWGIHTSTLLTFQKATAP